MPIARSFSKSCPACGSEKTDFTQNSAFERLLSKFTKLVKYRCRDCGRTFRAGDRRRFPRSGPGGKPSKTTKA